jgi:putative redox protein
MAVANVHVKWTGSLQFIGTDSGNHSTVISSHDENNHTGMRPSDMLLLALGSCSAYDVVKILEKKKVGLSNLEVDIQAQQSPDPPYQFKEIHLHFKVSGVSIQKKALEQAIELSLEKYCSVAATIRGVAHIKQSYEIIPLD